MNNNVLFVETGGIVSDTRINIAFYRSSIATDSTKSVAVWEASVRVRNASYVRLHYAAFDLNSKIIKPIATLPDSNGDVNDDNYTATQPVISADQNGKWFIAARYNDSTITSSRRAGLIFWKSNDGLTWTYAGFVTSGSVGLATIYTNPSITYTSDRWIIATQFSGGNSVGTLTYNKDRNDANRFATIGAFPTGTVTLTVFVIAQSDNQIYLGFSSNADLARTGKKYYMAYVAPGKTFGDSITWSPPANISKQFNYNPTDSNAIFTYIEYGPKLAFSNGYLIAVWYSVNYGYYYSRTPTNAQNNFTWSTPRKIANRTSENIGQPNLYDILPDNKGNIFMIFATDKGVMQIYYNIGSDIWSVASEFSNQLNIKSLSMSYYNDKFYVILVHNFRNNSIFDVTLVTKNTNNQNPPDLVLSFPIGPARTLPIGTIPIGLPLPS